MKAFQLIKVKDHNRITEFPIRRRDLTYAKPSTGIQQIELGLVNGQVIFCINSVDEFAWMLDEEETTSTTEMTIDTSGPKVMTKSELESALNHTTPITETPVKKNVIGRSRPAPKSSPTTSAAIE